MFKSILTSMVLTSILFGGQQIYAAPPITEQIGQCFAIKVRQGPQGISTALKAVCKPDSQSSLPDSSSLGQKYLWTAASFAFAFDEAERGICGFVTCVSKLSSVSIVLIPNGFPTAWVSETPDKRGIEILVNSGFVDFTMATVAGISVDVARDQGQAVDGLGFDAWLESMRDAGGKPTNSWRVPWPGPKQVTEEEFKQHVVLAHGIYTFLLGHELAHLYIGGHCGSQSMDALRVEMACDDTAFDALARQDIIVPVVVSDWMIATWYYINLKDRELQGLALDHQHSFRSMFPAIDFQSRGANFVRKWQGEVSLNPSKKLAIGSKALIPYANRIIASRPPKNSTAKSEEACQAIRVEQQAIEWDPTPSMPQVKYKYTVKNTSSDLKIEAEVEVQSGYVPRETSQITPFVTYKASSKLFQLDPGTSQELAGQIDWHATSRLIARLDNDVIMCKVLAKLPSQQTLGPFRDAVEKLMASALNGFHDIMGSQEQRDSEDDFNRYPSRITLPGSSSCTVWIYDDRRRIVRCKMFELNDSGLVTRKLQELKTALRGSTPADWQVEETEEKQTGLSTVLAISDSNNDRSITLQLSRSKVKQRISVLFNGKSGL